MNSTQYQRQRANHAKRYFLRVLEGVTPQQACLFASTAWPKHKWHIGQNGSIAGLVFHVTAWKLLTLPVLEGKPAILNVTEFDMNLAPDISDWSSLSSWAILIANRWETKLNELSDDAIETTLCTWDNGEMVTLSRIVTDMYEHDIQHAAQIEYLLARIEANDLNNNTF